MIIKSMGRRKSTAKNGQSLFATLLAYMLNEKGADIDLLHNLPHDIDREAIADAFQKNASLLFERKGGNIAYHEILSLPANDHDREKVKAALREIGQMYLDERASENIAVGIIHSDKEHLHLHIMLSSNRLLDRKRLRLSKKDFLMVQENVSSRAAARFPELQLDNLYTPDRVHSKKRESVRLSQGQQHEHQHGKERPKKTSRKVELSSILHGLLAQHRDRESLDAALKQHGLAIYQRGNTIGVIDQDGKKHRFGTLGVMVHYQEWQVHSQTQHKPKVDEKETSKPEQKSQEKPKKQSQETKTNQKQEKPKNQTSTKQSGKDFEAQLKQRMFEEQLNRRIDELKQARSQGRDRDDGAER
jgi:hypothetical protein